MHPLLSRSQRWTLGFFACALLAAMAAAAMMLSGRPGTPLAQVPLAGMTPEHRFPEQHSAGMLDLGLETAGFEGALAFNAPDATTVALEALDIPERRRWQDGLADTFLATSPGASADLRVSQREDPLEPTDRLPREVIRKYFPQLGGSAALAAELSPVEVLLKAYLKQRDAIRISGIVDTATGSKVRLIVEFFGVERTCTFDKALGHGSLGLRFFQAKDSRGNSHHGVIRYDIVEVTPYSVRIAATIVWTAPNSQLQETRGPIYRTYPLHKLRQV